MAADAFTQIRNALFRDPRLSAKAKGIFGFISTHRDGWGVTPESIAASMTDGVSAIRTGLRELEALGYLVREQPRRPDGTMGSIEYYITDRPSSEPVVENRPPVVTSGDAETSRSEPVVENPHAVEPHAADRPHKKISSKKTRGEKTLSPRAVPDQWSTPGSGLVEREIPAAPQDDTATVAATWATARGGRRNPAAEQAVAASARQLLTAGWPLADVTALAADMGRRQPTYRDLTRHADHWQPPTPAQRSGLPPWCGQCGDGMPAAEFNPRFRIRADGGLCACHPNAVPA